MTAVAAYSFLVFNLLCAPCFAAMGAIKREMNNTKWFLFAIGYQCLLAYVVSLCIYQIGTLATGGGFGLFTVIAFILIIGKDQERGKVRGSRENPSDGTVPGGLPQYTFLSGYGKISGRRTQTNRKQIGFQEVGLWEQ